MGEEGRNKGIKSIYGLIFGIFKRFCGAYPGFGAGGQELFLADKRQKKAVFFIQSQVLGSFCLQSKRPSSVTCSMCHSFRQCCAVILVYVHLDDYAQYLGTFPTSGMRCYLISV